MLDEAKIKTVNTVHNGRWDSRWQTNNHNLQSERKEREARFNSNTYKLENNNFIIITVASVFGTFVLLINFFIILYLAKNKRQKSKFQCKKNSSKFFILVL